jgi:hypothetical protein
MFQAAREANRVRDGKLRFPNHFHVRQLAADIIFMPQTRNEKPNHHQNKFWLLLFSFARLATGKDMNSSLAPVRTDNSISWFDIRQPGVEGRGWNDTKAFYDRLPGKAEGIVRPEVWDLSRHSAGMCVRFVTDATTIRARWALTLPALSQPNMAATGVSGLDFYVRTNDGQWRWLAVGIPEAQTNSVTLTENLVPGKREYLLYLPLHNGTEFVELGIPQGAILEPAGP